jgi:carbonic anhydrase/acetyltransferase-like protein (isoleucine patch superfamily)
MQNMQNNIRAYLHYQPTIGQQVMVDPSSVVIGRVTLSDDVSVWPLVVIRGDVNEIYIGARTNVQDGSVLHVTHQSATNTGFSLVIGEDVTIGHKAVLHGCTLQDRILVGMGAIVLDGVVVESDVMIGAGSLVPAGKRLESGYLYMGTPAKQVRPLRENELADLKASAQRYVAWKNDYLKNP